MKALPAVPLLQQKKEDEGSVQNEQLGETGQNSAADNGSTSTIQRFNAASASHNNNDSPSRFQPTPNLTGLPDQLKAGIEQQSGFAMDDVRVHYNSDKPAQLQAHAYAQGSNIHVAPGQEKHLAHEAWHVVQQKQGRVRPTIQMKGQVNINDDQGLEKEADEMGAKAMQLKVNLSDGNNISGHYSQSFGQATQGKEMNAGSIPTNGNVFQLTRMSTVDIAGYKAKMAGMLTWGPRIGEESGAGEVYKAVLKQETFDNYQQDEAGDVPVDEVVAVKVVSTAIEMNTDGDIPLEIEARDDIEAKNQEGATSYKAAITPDTFECITVTDPDKGNKVVKYVIIMRFEKEGTMSSKKIDRAGKYTPEFDKKMKKYANEIKAALEVVKAAGYHPGDMKADNTLITDVDGDTSPRRAILADFGSYRKAAYNNIMDDITTIMNFIFASKGKLDPKEKPEVTTWMADNKLWEPVQTADASTQTEEVTE